MACVAYAKKLKWKNKSYSVIPKLNWELRIDALATSSRY